MELRYQEHEVDLIATVLYDGGWKAEDKELLMQEYGMSEENTTLICEKLTEIAKRGD